MGREREEEEERVRGGRMERGWGCGKVVLMIRAGIRRKAQC